MPKRNLSITAGFAPLELLLVVVGILIVGFVAWDVYHIKSSSDALLAPSSSSSPTFKKPATATSSAATSATTGDSDSSLQTDLNAANTANAQSGQDMNATNNSLNDQSTLTTVPQ